MVFDLTLKVLPLDDGRFAKVSISLGPELASPTIMATDQLFLRLQDLTNNRLQTMCNQITNHIKTQRSKT